MRHAVESALSSTEIPIEIIVVEDRSDDASYSLADLIADNKIRYISKKTGASGASETRNFGAFAASNKYLLFLDDDDIVLPGYINTLCEVLKSDEYRWGFCDQLVNGKLSKPRSKLSSRLVSGSLQNKIAATSAGFWVQRELFIAVGGFDERQSIDEDTDICCRLLSSGHPPYYLRKAGVRLSRNDGLERLTTATDYSKVVECYKRTFIKNGVNFRADRDAWRYLIDRVHRVICKSHDANTLREIRSYDRDWLLSLTWWLREMKYFKMSN